MDNLLGHRADEKLLGQMLIKAGVISEQHLKVALESQRENPAPLGVTLVKLGIAKEEDILPILAEQLNRIDVVLDVSKNADTESKSVLEALDKLIVRFIEKGVSDLHFEPEAAGVKMRIRVDGILHEVDPPTVLKHDYAATVSRIKVMCNLDIAEKRLPQDGRTSMKSGGREMDLRISILPARYGEAVVIRFLQTDIPVGLPQLGLDAAFLDIYQKLLQRHHGIILVTGPTGSGKTTTLYASLDYLNDSTKKIVTIEDPIEYSLPGVLQMQVKPTIELTFGKLLRSVLRHDPDVLMIGEVRDTETAEVAIRMALTGHLVLSTLHTNDAASYVARLLDMGVEPYLVASSVSCVIPQRLVRRVCSECKGKRCRACLWLGLKGRAGIFECLVMDEPMRKLVTHHASSEEIREYATVHGMRTLYQDGLEKIQAGITTQDELGRVIRSDEFV